MADTPSSLLLPTRCFYGRELLNFIAPIFSDPRSWVLLICYKVGDLQRCTGVVGNRDLVVPQIRITRNLRWWSLAIQNLSPFYGLANQTRGLDALHSNLSVARGWNPEYLPKISAQRTHRWWFVVLDILKNNRAVWVCVGDNKEEPRIGWNRQI